MAVSMTDGTGFIWQAHPAQVTLLHEYVHVPWLCDEGGAKRASERNWQCTSPQNTFHLCCPCFKGSPEKKVTWIVLEVCISFCHAATEPQGCQRYGHSMDAHSVMWLRCLQESSWEQDIKIIQNTRRATTRQVAAEKDCGIVTYHKMNINHWCCLAKTAKTRMSYQSIKNKSAVNKTPWSNPLLAMSTQKAPCWNTECGFGYHISRKTGANSMDLETVKDMKRGWPKKKEERERL